MIEPTLLLFMILAALGAVALYTFIGFIPGTDETSVLLPISLALVLTGVHPMIILTFFIASIVTLNLANAMPTALVGLPGGVMSSPMIEHAILIKNEGRSAFIIQKMAAASALGVIISVPVALLVANIIVRYADGVRQYAAYLFVIGAIFLSLTSRNKIISLMSIIPLALLFQSLRHLYWGIGIVPQTTTVTISFFLGITIGPLLVSLFQLLNKTMLKQQEVQEKKLIILPSDESKQKTINPFKILTKEEKKYASISALVVNFFFVLSPVGLTILIGEAVGNKFKSDPQKRSTMTMTTMSAIIQSTYMSQIVIPLFALGIALSPVALGPGAALFNAEPIFTIDNNIHHILTGFQFTISVLIGASIAVVLSYILISKYAKTITLFILKYIPHEAVLGLFIAFIMLLAFMDAGLINIFGVLLVGLVCGTLNKMGVNYGVQFMSLYAAPTIVGFFLGVF
ncbi:tripartite tricarboxylate transporter permease [Liberiplasma polymorphum]|uniref:tripartite tricarboxylate transporter permease n=1 Tax=Liberiplasma polymorphum TaxID=3374570 RepID=UPI0037736E40